MCTKGASDSDTWPALLVPLVNGTDRGRDRETYKALQSENEIKRENEAKNRSKTARS